MTPPTHPLQDGSFDPLALLRRSRGNVDDIRDIKLRLLWLRQREPEARVRTKLISLDERTVVLSARISLPEGGEGSGHAASRIDGSADLAEVIETTELRAIGRALDVIGYVVTEQTSEPRSSQPEPTAERLSTPTPSPDPATEDPAPTPPVETPRRQPPEHIQAIRALREREQQATASTTEQHPTVAEPEPGPPAPTPIDRRQPRPQAVPAPPPADDDDEPELEDISWTAFWKWARVEHQIGSRGQVEEMLGQPVDRKSPGELRRLLNAHFESQSPGDS